MKRMAIQIENSKEDLYLTISKFRKGMIFFSKKMEESLLGCINCGALIPFTDKNADIACIKCKLTQKIGNAYVTECEQQPTKPSEALPEIVETSKDKVAPGIKRKKI